MSELGNRLKQAREERKLSLDDLQAITKIQKRYLLGIEEGNYGMMPGNFYVRAFIKQYAEAVGLDPEKLFDEYKNEIPIVHTEETIELSRVKTHKELPKSASKVLEFLPRILIIAVVILAAVIIWITVQNKPDSSGQADQPKQTSSGENEYDAIESPEEPEPKETDTGSAPPAEEDKPAEEKPAEPASEVVFKETAGRKAVYELTKAEQFKLDVTSSGTTWIEIRNASGKKFFSGMLNKGKTESHDFTNETEAFIVIGNASAAQIKVNGKPVEYKIDPKKTVRQDMQIVYTKE